MYGMKIEKVGLSNQNAKSLKNAALISSFITASIGAGIKSAPIKDTFEISSANNNSKIFIQDIIQGKDKSAEQVLKTFDFTQYGKNGLPLKYSRKNFVKDLKFVTMMFPKQKKAQMLGKFNLRLGQGDIDGIASLQGSDANGFTDKKFQQHIEKFYNNKVDIEDIKVQEAMQKIINGMPEFTMTIGKVQHGTHVYSVDIHTLEVLQKSLNHPEYENLSDEGKQVLKLSVLMHDFGKNGNVVTKGHARQSKADAKMVLENYDISQNIKDRVLNQVENHHWFESFNKGLTTADDVKNIFKTPEDLKIAKIMAKSDLESISPDFHRHILNEDKFLTQAEFDEEFAQKMAKVSY